jgi:hypothetical protein
MELNLNGCRILPPKKWEKKKHPLIETMVCWEIHIIGTIYKG